ncbi:Os12g0235600, partial [Oryza sativa Japonica Group]
TLVEPSTNRRRHLNTMKNDGNSMPDLSTQSSLFFRRGTLANVTNLTAAEVRRKHDRERYFHEGK